MNRRGFQRKLRGQFITLTLTSVISVVVIVLISVNFMVYTSINAGADSDIDRLWSRIGDSDDFYSLYSTTPAYTGGFDSVPAAGDVTFFVIRRTADGELNRRDTDSIPNLTAEDARRLAQSALNNYSGTGNVEIYRYRIYEGENGDKTVVFLNISNSIAFFHRLLRMSIIVALIGSLVAALSVFVISDGVSASAARSIDRQKQFITNAGHDLKTPIAVISANMDVLSLTNGENQWISSTKKQVSRLKRLVGDLIDVSKLSEDSISLEFEAIDMSALCRETAELCGEMAQLRDVEFANTIEDDIKIYGSEQYLRRLLTILCDNALKYTDQGGRIEMTLSRYKNGGYFSLYNTCSKVGELELDRIFDRFYRGDKARSGDTGGSGIGLAVAAAIVEAHGGEINARQEVGGIVFEVNLKG